MSCKILVINPGSTSTKVAVFDAEEKVFEKSIAHTPDELKDFERVIDQFEFREKVISSVLKENNFDVRELEAVVARGGMFPKIEAGGYLVNKAMIDTLNEGLASPHASNLGALIANKIAEPLGIPAYIYDAVTSDELMKTAKISGMPDVEKQSICHVLNMKAMARRVAKKYGKTYEDMDLLVAHMGGGISVSVHHNGKIIDCVRDDEGPFSPERSGGIPTLCMVDLCYSGKYTKLEMIKKIRGRGGLMGYLNTQDLRDVEAMIAEGDKHAEEIYNAMVLQITKGIGQLAPVLGGSYDCIILTGGMAYSKKLTQMIKEKVEFIAPVEIEPGEDEMGSLALGALRLLRGQEKAKNYVHP
ncbi:MAG: butyrate kinase [Anaerovoracaceae bacterium]